MGQCPQGRDCTYSHRDDDIKAYKELIGPDACARIKKSLEARQAKKNANANANGQPTTNANANAATRRADATPTGTPTKSTVAGNKYVLGGGAQGKAGSSQLQLAFGTDARPTLNARVRSALGALARLRVGARSAVPREHATLRGQVDEPNEGADTPF